MDLAVILGGNTLFGEKIAERLIGLGMRVVAFGGDFGGVSPVHPDFRKVAVDPLDPAAIDAALDELTAGSGVVYALILAGRVAARQPLEGVHGDDLAPFVTANIDYPLRVVHRLLPQLIRSRGYLMRLGWNGRGDAPGYCLDAMVEGAWQQFFRKLFEEIRDTGVKVSTVYPEPNPVNGSTVHSGRSQSALNPELVGEAVEGIFRMRECNLISEIVIRPQATREEPRIPQTFDRIAVSRPVPQLPDKDNLPGPAPAIPTPRPQRPAHAVSAAGHEDEEDDIELDEEELKLLKSSIEAVERASEHDQSPSRRRGRRRRRGRKHSGDGSGSPNSGQTDRPSPEKHPPNPVSDNRPEAPAQKAAPAATGETAPAPKPASAKKRPARKTARKRAVAPPADGPSAEKA